VADWAAEAGLVATASERAFLSSITALRLR
jgi:hypothetical protein